MKLGVSYFGNRMPRHFIQRDLPEIVDAGCTFVLHTFSEEDLEFYGGAVLEMVIASKDAGLEVYMDPWGVAGVFGGETYSRFLLRHPEAWQVRGDGIRVPVACPNAFALRELMAHWSEAAAKMGADVLFWDEPHFVEENPVADAFCHCGVCRGLFLERYGTPMPSTKTAQGAEFQEESIIGFLDTLCRGGAANGMRNAVCLLPFEDERYGLGDWEKIAALPDLDILGVTPFWHLRGHEAGSYVKEWTDRVVSLCKAHGKETQVWLQGFLVDEGREHELSHAAEAAYEAGARNIATWGFRACEHITALRPGRPELLWQEVRASFARFAAR